MKKINLNRLNKLEILNDEIFNNNFFVIHKDIIVTKESIFFVVPRKILFDTKTLVNALSNYVLDGVNGFSHQIKNKIKPVYDVDKIQSKDVILLPEIIFGDYYLELILKSTQNYNEVKEIFDKNVVFKSFYKLSNLSNLPYMSAGIVKNELIKIQKNNPDEFDTIVKLIADEFDESKIVSKFIPMNFLTVPTFIEKLKTYLN